MISLTNEIRVNLTNKVLWLIIVFVFSAGGLYAQNQMIRGDIEHMTEDLKSDIDDLKTEIRYLKWSRDAAGLEISGPLPREEDTDF